MKAGIASTEGGRVPLLSNARENLIVTIIFGLALGLRLFLVFHTYLITNDGILYVRLAKLISKGEFGVAFSISFFNLYPFVIALFQKIFNDWELSGQMVSVVFGSLTVIPLYFLTKSLFSRTVAMVSSVLFVFHPYLVRFSAEVIRGPIFWFFFVMALWVGWEAISRKGPWLFAMTGIFGTLSFLFRPEGIFVVALVGVWTIFSNRKTWSQSLRQRILFVLILFLPVPMLVSPALLYLRGKTGRWHWARAEEIPRLAFSDIKMSAIKKNFDQIKVMPWDNRPEGQIALIRLKAFLSLARDHRIGVIGLELWSKFLKAMHPILFIILVFGVIKRKVVRYHKEEDLFLVSVLAMIVVVLFRYGTVTAYVGTRHMMAPVTLCLAWAGAGLVEVEHRIRNIFPIEKLTRPRIAGMTSIEWALVILIILALLPKTLASQRFEKRPIREAGVWIKENGPKSPVVMCQGGLARVAFYADGTFLEIPRDQDLFEYAKKSQATFLALNEKSIEKTHPGLIHALDQNQFREEITIGESSGPYVIRIYSVKD